MAHLINFGQIYVGMLGPEQNGHHPADTIFKCIFSKENICILIQLSLKFFYGFNCQLVNIALGNGLALYRRHTITWINVDQDLWRHMVPLGHNELTGNCMFNIHSVTIFHEILSAMLNNVWSAGTYSKSLMDKYTLNDVYIEWYCDNITGNSTVSSIVCSA